VRDDFSFCGRLGAAAWKDVMYRELSDFPLHGTLDEARTREARSREPIPSPREVMIEAGLTLAVVAAFVAAVCLVLALAGVQPPG
jgi:hypothetical protein